MKMLKFELSKNGLSLIIGGSTLLKKLKKIFDSQDIFSKDLSGALVELNNSNEAKGKDIAINIGEGETFVLEVSETAKEVSKPKGS